MKGRTISLVGNGFEPKRFVVVVVPWLMEHCTFEIDDAPIGRDAARGYFASILRQEPNKDRATTLIASALVNLAGQDAPDHSNAYLNAFALTEALGQDYIVVEIRKSSKPLTIRPIQAS